MNQIGILVFVVVVANSAILPSSFTKCNRNSKNFSECLAKAAENAIKQLDNNALQNVGLPSFGPLKIPSLVIGAGTGAVDVVQNYKNMKIRGYSDIKCDKAAMDFQNKTFFLDCTIPKYVVESDYEINGNIFLIKVVGKGFQTIIIDGLHVIYTVTLEEYKKHGKKYFKITNGTLSQEPKKIHFDLENLFDGNKLLGDNINAVLNDNWAEVFKDVKSAYEEALEQIYSSIFGNLLAKVSVDDLFDH